MSVIQTYPAVPFIFYGSSKPVIENMFMSPGRPFYQSSELMYLGKIGDDNYRYFIAEKFKGGNMGIDDRAINKIFNWTRLYTYYV